MEKLTIFLSHYLKCPEKELYKYLIEEINSFPNNYFSLFFLDSFKLFYKDQQLIIDQKMVWKLLIIYLYIFYVSLIGKNQRKSIGIHPCL